MEQEENKHKTIPTGKVKNGRKTNTTTSLTIVTYNDGVLRIKSLDLN